MYLDDLDGVLRAGLSTLSPALRERQRRFVLERQRPDGGFAGRQGASDLYYTDFALRMLYLLDAEREPLERAMPFVTQAAARPRDAIDAFGALNAARIFKTMHIDPDNHRGALRLPEKSEYVLGGLQSGGVARPGGTQASAYYTFLAALCLEMLEEPFPNAGATARAIRQLKRSDGGFADVAGGPAGQTNATAAAVAVLILTGAMTSPDPATVSFLVAMQAGDGGFRAAAEAPESDLLSTFTALVSLFVLDGLKRIDLAAAVRWIGRLAAPEGGFRATLSDDEPDLEYTFYGLGSLAIVRAYAGLMKAL